MILKPRFEAFGVSSVLNRRFRLPICCTDYRRYSKRLMRSWVFQRFNYTCVWCEKVFPYEELTLDHLVPRSKNGRNGFSNLVASCADCNVKRQNE